MLSVLAQCLESYHRTEMDLDGLCHMLLRATLDLSKGKYGYVACSTALEPDHMRYAATVGMDLYLKAQDVRVYKPNRTFFTPPHIRARWVLVPLTLHRKLHGVMGFENATALAHAEFKTLLEPLVPRLATVLLDVHLTARTVATQQDLFLSTMSHEIRTPLNGIVGLGRILRESQPWTDEQRTYLKAMSECTYQLLDLINDILDFSKMDCDQLQLQVEPFPVRACIEEVYDLVYLRVQEKKINLWYTVADSVPQQVRGDRKRLRQVLLNLINNAIKFTDHGQIDVRVTAQRSATTTPVPPAVILVPSTTTTPDPPTTTPATTTTPVPPTATTPATTTTTTPVPPAVISTTTTTISVPPPPSPMDIAPSSAGTRFCELHFEIQDTGVGIPKEQQDHVFKSFQQIRTQRPQTDGVGLGLAICKKLCQLMGGDIAIRTSQVGQGTCMHFFLPLEEVKNDPPPAPRVVTMPPNKRILLVDAQLGRRLQWIEALGQLHLHPYACGTLEEALAYLKVLPIDAVLAEASTRPHWPSALPVAFVDQTPLADAPTLLQALWAAPSLPVGLPSVPMPRYALDVLVVEDNPYNMMVIYEMLKKLGVDERSIDKALTGTESIQKALTKPYDVILMDLLLPTVDGVSAGTQILNYYRARCPQHLKYSLDRYESLLPTIVALTAMVTPETQQRCKAAGFKGFLTKPLDKEELETMLTIVAKRRQQSRKSLASG